MLRIAALSRPLSLSSNLRAWLAAIAVLIPVSWLLIHGQFRVLAFVFCLAALVVATVVDKSFAICLILGYLFLLGDIRRALGTIIGFSKFDPLLLVGPLVTILLALPLLLRVRLKDSISKAMVALMAVMALEIVNPRQGPISVGLAGAMFYLLPLLWFWIGRRYGSDTLLFFIIYRVVIPLSVLAALLGLWQTYVGFLPWEQEWISAVASHYHALSLGGGFTRAFGFSVNGIEYSNLLLIGSTCVLAASFSGRRVYGLLFPLLAFALFLASSRTAIVKLLFAIAISWAVSNRGGRGWAVRLPIALAVIFGGLAFLLSQVSHGGAGQNSAAGFSTQHQIEGLANPLDSKKSTAGTHATMFLGGIKEGFTSPMGSGLGAVTMGGKLGGEGGGSSSSDSDASAGNTEVDISDAFVSMGLLGGLLYLFTILLVLRRAIQFGRTAPKYLGLPALALLAAMGGGWTALGQYGVGPLVWFVIGVLARNSDRSAARVPKGRTARPPLSTTGFKPGKLPSPTS
jgi:hypothetical protein